MGLWQFFFFFLSRLRCPFLRKQWTKETVAHILGRLSAEERQRRVLVVDNDLEGSCGLKKVREFKMWAVRV